jgi:hypothetical protein
MKFMRQRNVEVGEKKTEEDNGGINGEIAEEFCEGLVRGRSEV